MQIDCFIFDFDGTLARSETAYNAAFCHTLRLHLGLEVTGEPSRGSWSATPSEVLRQYSEHCLDDMLQSFEEYYYANHHEHLALYDGIGDLLHHLNGMGAAIGIVSLKPRRAGELELDITGLRDMVHSVVWGDEVARPKPEADGVLKVIADLGSSSDKAIVVGDSVADIKMGRAAGTRTAAALWSGCTADELIAAAPDFTFDSPGDLISTLAKGETR